VNIGDLMQRDLNNLNERLRIFREREESLRNQLVQAQKMEAMGTLVDGIAHEFNNMLQIIVGFTQLLLMNKSKGQADYEDLMNIWATCQRAADLVKSLMTFAGKSWISLGPVKLNRAVEQTKDLLLKTLPRMVKIRFRLTEDLKTVRGDLEQIELIIVNLAVNARDAMPDGGELTLATDNVVLDEEYCTTHPGAKPGEYVRLTVSDTGHGIDKDTLSRVFDPFFTTRGLGNRSGLGLAVVRGIVEMHRGYITCESAVGKGTKFEAFFPVTAMEQEIEGPAQQIAPPVSLPETILLVEDEELVRELGQELLTGAGFKVITAADGKQALEVYRKEGAGISLVILDLLMPEMGGRQCLEELLKMDPDVKIIVSSGFSADQPTRDFLEARAKGFLTKPHDMDEVLMEVRRVLSES
jgi:nitrogen-specific signal transduction histidine kinase